MSPAALPFMLLVACRLAGLLAIFPAWDGSQLTMRWRAAVAVVLTLLVAPACAASTAGNLPTFENVWAWGLAGAQEAVVGAVVGVSLRVVWSATTWTAQLIGVPSGLTLAEVFDPGTGESSPAVGQLLTLTVTAAWFGVGGHRQLLVGLLDTFQAAPPGTVTLDAPLTPLLVELLTRSTLAGIRAGAPLAAVLLASWCVIAGVTRLAPRSAAWMWSASLATVLGLAGLSVSLGYVNVTIQEHFESAWDVLGESLHEREGSAKK